MVTENDIRCQSHTKQDQQTMRKRGAKTVRLKVQKHAMAEIVFCSATSSETLMKASVSTSSGCLLCGTEQSDSQKRTNLKGKLKIEDVTEIAANALTNARHIRHIKMPKRVRV